LQQHAADLQRVTIIPTKRFGNILTDFMGMYQIRPGPILINFYSAVFAEMHFFKI